MTPSAAAIAPMSEEFENRMHELEEIAPQAHGFDRARDLLPSRVPAAVFNDAARVAPCHPHVAACQQPPTLAMPVLILTGGIDKVVAAWLKADLLRLTPFTRHIEMSGLAHARICRRLPPATP